MRCAIAQMRSAFGQSYQQWQNANEIRQMRAHLANPTDNDQMCTPLDLKEKKDLKRVSAYNYRNKNSTVVNV